MGLAREKISHTQAEVNVTRSFIKNKSQSQPKAERITLIPTDVVPARRATLAMEVTENVHML